MHIGIAIQTNATLSPGQQGYVQALLTALPALAPHHIFTFFTNAAVQAPLPVAVQVRQVPLHNSYFGLRHWYQKGFPALLQQEGVDALVLLNAPPASLSVPQVSIILSTSGSLAACNTWLQFLYKRFLWKRLKKTATVGVLSKLQAPEMQQLLCIPESQLFATGYATPATYQPAADWQQREQFLQQQTGGREYFLYTGSFHEAHFLHLLKAFSLFKKRQQSNMQLLVPLHAEAEKKLLEKLDSYKYRQDVQLLHQPNPMLVAQLMSGAYAVLFIEERGTTAYPVAAAMQCGIPVIGRDSNAALSEVAGTAALYADATVENLADQMKLVYKDETLRQRLMVAALQQAQQANGSEAARVILGRIVAQ